MCVCESVEYIIDGRQRIRAAQARACHKWSKINLENLCPLRARPVELFRGVSLYMCVGEGVIDRTGVFRKWSLRMCDTHTPARGG